MEALRQKDYTKQRQQIIEELRQKESYSIVEIYGAEKVFNIAYENEFGYDPNEELFISGSMLNSTSDCNGAALDIYGYPLSHLGILPNGMLVAVCYDEHENEHLFRVETSNITELYPNE